MTYRFMSFGAGVQTVALLLMWDSLNVEEAIFADTKGEWPETYDYLERWVMPHVRDKGIKFTVVSDPVTASRETTPFSTSSLEAFCLGIRKIPSRNKRWCTEKFKILRIKRYIKSLPGIELPATSLMGISWDEMARMHASHSRAWNFEYPLVDRRMGRKDCEKVITDHGWPIPHKSGCYYCPFLSKRGEHELYLKHPDLYKRRMRMEENTTRFPYALLSGTNKTQRRLANSFGEGSQKLEMFIDGADLCESGFCMT